MPVAGLNPGPVIDFEQPSVFAAPARCGHSNQMTPEQIAEAKRLAAEWKPGDCGAEAVA